MLNDFHQGRRYCHMLGHGHRSEFIGTYWCCSGRRLLWDLWISQALVQTLVPAFLQGNSIWVCRWRRCTSTPKRSRRAGGASWSAGRPAAQGEVISASIWNRVSKVFCEWMKVVWVILLGAREVTVYYPSLMFSCFFHVGILMLVFSLCCCCCVKIVYTIRYS